MHSSPARILLFALLSLFFSNILGFQVTISPPNIVHQVNQYAFTENGNYDHSQTTYTLTFPSEFDLSGLTSSSCSTTSFNLEIHSCVIDHEARQIQMSMTIENTFFFVVSQALSQIKDVKNPSLAGAYTIFGAFTYNNIPITGDQSVEVDPLTMNAISLISSSSVTNTLAHLSVSIDTTEALSNGDTFRLVLSQWYAPTPSTHYITVSSPVCQFSISGNAFQTASSCAYDQATFTLEARLPGSVPANDAVDLVLKVEDFRTPPTTESVGSGFKAYLINQGGVILEKKESGISLSVSEPNSSLITQVFMNPNTVGTAARYEFQINPDYYPAQAQLQITFPSEIKFTDATGQNLFINVTGAATQSIIPGTQNNQVITLTEVTSVAGTGSLHFFLYNALNPQTQTATSPFLVILKDSSGYSIFKSSTTTVTAQALGISEASVSAVTPTVGSLSNYVVSFKAASQPPSDGSIVLVFPADVEIQATAACYTFLNLNPSTSCSISSNQVSLSSPFESGYTHDTTVQIGVSQVLNPSSVKTTANFEISVYTASGAKVQSTTTSGGADVTFTASVASLSEFTVESSSATTTTDQVMLQFSFKTPGIIVSGSIFNLSFPTDDVPIAKGHDSASNCQSVSNLSTISCTFTSPDLFRVQDGFASSVSSHTLLSLSLSELTNPRSTLSTGQFQLNLMNSAGYASYSGSAALTLTEAVQFTNGRVKASSFQNGLPNPYTFWLTSPAAVLTTDFIRVTLASGIQFSSSNPLCEGESPLAASLSCSLQGDQLYIQTSRADGSDNQISAGQEISFSVTNITNQAGIGTSPSLALAQVIQNSGLYYEVGMKDTDLTVVTSQEAVFSELSVTPSDSRVGVSTSYVLSFVSPVSPIPQAATIDLTFPPEISLPQNSFQLVSCTGSGGLANTPTCSVVNGNIVRITDGFPSDTTNLQISATIGGITNGDASSSSQSFSLKFLTSSGAIISSSSSGLAVTFTCDDICETCVTSSSQCSSCDTSSTHPYYLDSHSNCYDNCPDGFFSTQSYLCAACSTDCRTCLTSPTTCTSCVAQSGLPYLYQQNCKDECPDTTYAISNECLACTSPCRTCGTTSTQCTSCDSESGSPFLHQQQCLNSCPEGYVGLANVCQQCSDPCRTCSGTQSQCTACNSGYLERGTCVDSCSSNFALNQDGTQCLPVTQRRDQVLYFAFLAVFAITVVTLLIVRCYLEFVKFWTSAIALGSLVQTAVWFFMFYFLWRDNHYTSFAIVGAALFFHYLTNLILMCCYFRLLRRDGGFNHYRDKYRCTVGWVLATSILTSHKFFRLLGSFLFHQNKLNVYLSKQSRWVRLVSLISVASMLLSTLPILFACGFNIFYNTVHLQLFYTDIEVAIITLTLWIFEIIEVRYERTNLTEEVKDKRNQPGDPYREKPSLRLNTFDDQDTQHPSVFMPYFAEFSLQRVRDERQTRSECELNQAPSLPRQRRASYPASPRTQALAVAILMKDKRYLPTPPFDASGITGEGEISADVPISIPGGDISFTQKRPGKIRDPMHVNATPNRLNAAQTQGPDQQDLKYQTPIRNREPPELYMNDPVVVVRHSQNGDYFQDLEAQGVVPRLVESNQSVDYYSASDIEIDMIDKSTERQLMNDMSGFEAFRGGSQK